MRIDPPSLVVLLCVAVATQVCPSASVAQDPPADAPADAHPVLPSAPEVERLPNGLTVVTVPWESPGIVAYYTLVRVGSRDEVESGHSGFAHLFEHMMFRGTERFPEKEYERRIQSFGADNNAYTTQDFTMYTVTAPTAVLPELVELEADRFQRLSYDEAQFRTETGAVLGEYNKSASNPFLQMWEALSELAFERHTYGHTTLGYLRDIKAMPEKLAYSRKFFRRFYTPDNTTLIVVGDFDRSALLDLVRQEYGGWRGKRHPSRVPIEPEPDEGARRDLEWEGTTPPRMFVGYRAPAFAGRGRRSKADRAEALKRTAALEVVHGLLFDESSPLYQRLVVEERSLLELESWNGWFHRDPHLFVTSATLKPGTDFEPILEAIQEAMDQLAAGELPPERFAAVRSHLRYALIGSLETPDDVANLLGEFIAVGGSVEALEQYLRALDAITPENVVEAAKKYLVAGRRFVVTLTPAGATDE